MSLLPGSIADERFLALEQVWANRLAALPIEVVLIKFIREAPSAALPHLADEFGALDEVWNAASEEEKVALLERALDRRRHRGTRWAVRDALSAIGFDPVEMRFRPDLLADGSLYADGTFPAAGANRFVFWLTLLGPLLEGAALARVVKAFLAWRQRSVHLGEIYYVHEATDFGDPAQYQSEHTQVVFVGAYVPTSGTELRLWFSRRLDAASLPSPGDFAIAGAPVTVASVAVDGDECVLTLSGGVSPVESLTVDYTPGATRLRSALTGNEAPALVDEVVDNGSEWLLPERFAPVFWIRGDDAGATLSGGAFTAIPNRGSYGGSITALAGGGALAGPTIWSIAGKRAPDFRDGETFQGSVDSLRLIHEPAVNATLFTTFVFAVGGVSAYVLRDYPSGNLLGIHLERTSSNALNFVVKDGTNQTLFLASAANAIVPGTVYRCIIRKTGTFFELFLNGALLYSGTATSLVAGASSMTARIGGYAPTTAPMTGSIAEVGVIPSALSDGARDLMNAYMAQRFTRSVPLADDPILAFAGDDPSATFASSPVLLIDPANAAVDGSGNVTNLANEGSAAGNLVPITGSGPQLVTIGGESALRTTTNGGLTFGSTATLAFLHEPNTTAEVMITVDFDSGAPAVDGWFFATRGSSATSRGLVLYQTTNGRCALAVSDGASNVVFIQTGTGRTGTHEYRVLKRGHIYSLYEDGALVSSATAATLTSGVSGEVPQLGSRLTDSNRLAGAIVGRVRVFPYDTSVGPTYITVPNRGLLGGNVTPASGVGPERTNVNGLSAPLFTTNGGLTFGTTISPAALHSPAINATLSFVMRVDGAPSVHSRPISTRGSAIGLRGVILHFRTNRRFRLVVGDGVSDVLDVTGSTDIADGLYLVQVRKTSTLYELFLDGVLYLSGTASALTPGAADRALCIGGTIGDTELFLGSIPELRLVEHAKSDSALAAERDHLSRWAA